MLKKYKQLVIGIFIGALLVSAMPVTAAVQKFVLSKIGYKIIVNGAEYKDDAQPALNYNGTTYVPLKALGKLLGQEPRWNAEKKQVELGTVKNEAPDPSIWIWVRDIDNTTLSKMQSLIDQMQKYKSTGIYSLEYGDKTVRMQIHNSRTYVNIQDLKDSGIFSVDLTLPQAMVQNNVSIILDKVTQDSDSLKIYFTYINNDTTQVLTGDSLTKIVCSGKQYEYNHDFNFSRYYEKNIKAPTSIESGVTSSSIVFFEPIPNVNKINIVLSANFNDYRFNNVLVEKLN